MNRKVLLSAAASFFLLFTPSIILADPFSDATQEKPVYDTRPQPASEEIRQHSIEAGKMDTSDDAYTRPSSADTNKTSGQSMGYEIEDVK